MDPKTGVAFGWARVNYPSGEWGYVNLIELEELCIAPRAVGQGGRLVGIYPQILVERDLHFTPTLARDCLPDDY